MYTSDFCIFNGYMNGVCDWIMSDEKRLALLTEQPNPNCVKLLIVSLCVVALVCGAVLRWTLQTMFHGVNTSMLTIAMLTVSKRYGSSATNEP